MDPDFLRLILLVLGVLLVAGIYLWDRYKRAGRQFRTLKRSPGAMSFDSAVIDDGAAERAEPTMHDAVESIPEMRVHESDAGSDPADVLAQTESMLDPEPEDLGEWSDAKHDHEPQFSMDLNFDAHGDSDYLHTDPTLHDEVERKLVVINLVARGGTIPGSAIEQACRAVDLELGDMSIYHRHAGGGDRVLFSMASMVEPGSFPADDMAGFATPGLSLFTQLPGVRDGVVIYDEMLAVADRLAALLHVELQDERHNKLTRQMRDHTRESIIDHRRRIKLARSRH